jgi:hypothetical protein
MRRGLAITAGTARARPIGRDATRRQLAGRIRFPVAISESEVLPSCGDLHIEPQIVTARAAKAVTGVPVEEACVVGVDDDDLSASNVGAGDDGLQRVAKQLRAPLLVFVASTGHVKGKLGEQPARCRTQHAVS